MCLDILCGREDFSTQLKEWGVVEGEKYKTSLSPPPSDILHTSPLARKKGEKDKKKERKKEEDHTGNVHSFRKQFYVTYK